MPLIRVADPIYAPYSSFNQRINTNGQKTFTGLTINYMIQSCVSGIVFEFSDNTTVTTGYSFDHQQKLELTNKKLSAVNSNCGAIVDCIQFCAQDELSNETCITAGTGAVPNYFVSTIAIRIESFYGDYYNYAGWLCLLNFGAILSPSNNTSNSMDVPPQISKIIILFAQNILHLSF